MSFIPLSAPTSSESINTPWQVLYNSQSDWAFITTMDVNVAIFMSLLTVGFAQCWYETPIPHDDVNVHGNPCIGWCSLDAVGALGLVLHYLSSTIHAVSLKQIFAVIPSTATRYLTFGLWLLLCTLCTTHRNAKGPGLVTIKHWVCRC